MEENNATCQVCGKRYHARYGGRYCSNECRKAAGSKYVSQKTPPRLRKCIVCGNEFLVQGTKAKICSEECRKINRREIQRRCAQNRNKIKRVADDPNGRKYEREFFKERERIRAYRHTDQARILDVNAEAKRIGVSYGEYVGMQATLSPERFEEWKVKSAKKYKQYQERNAN